MNNYDSDEELYMSWWLKELVSKGYIKYFDHQPKPFELSNSLWCEYDEHMVTKTKQVNEEILKGHIYTTDYRIVWHESAIDIFTTKIDSSTRKKKGPSMLYILSDYNDNGELESFVEVKPSFDQNNMTRLAKINQKWVWEKYNKYINIVIPEKHFNKTFTPERFMFTNKSMQQRKIKYKNIFKLEDYVLFLPKI